MNRRVAAPFTAGTTLLLIFAALFSLSGGPGRIIAALGPEAPLAAQPGPLIEPLDGPYIVAVQPGHWKIDELPPEMTRRGERSAGAVHAGVREADINLAVVEALVPLLEAEGWEVLVIPATVPPDLRADVFISIHADWGADVARNGWKLAPPWNPSAAARGLSNALKESFRAETLLKEDLGGVTVGMRGYFGFASHRYTYASSPYTPAVLVELGFVTNPEERRRMVSEPEYYAGIIHRGIRTHFSRWTRMDMASLVPRELDPMVVGGGGALAYTIPDRSSAPVHEYSPGNVIRPVDTADGWYEVRLRRPWQIVFVSADDLQPYEQISAREPTFGAP